MNAEPEPAAGGSGPSGTSDRYEFRVAGRLSPALCDAFEGLTVQEVPTETSLCGPVTDEAHLHGLLALMQSLGLQVVSLHRLPP
ncbi:MAG: hypothetical protein L0I76_25435 [Pseudonocardia sp.]|nr:hypothetical protein [Pseudonocardia sp.]